MTTLETTAQLSPEPSLKQAHSSRSEEGPQPSQTIPKLRLRPLSSKRIDPPSPVAHERSESPQVTPPPALKKKELRQQTAIALNALLGPPKGRTVRAHKVSSTPGTDSSSDGSDLDNGRRSLTPSSQKRKRAGSEASELLSAPEITSLMDGSSEEDQEVDELDEDQLSSGSDAEMDETGE